MRLVRLSCELLDPGELLHVAVNDLRKRITSLVPDLELIVRLSKRGKVSEALLRIADETYTRLEEEAAYISKRESGDSTCGGPSTSDWLEYEQLVQFASHDVALFVQERLIKKVFGEDGPYFEPWRVVTPEAVLEVSSELKQSIGEMLELVPIEEAKEDVGNRSPGRPPEPIDQLIVDAFEEAGRPTESREFSLLVRTIQPDLLDKEIKALLRKLRVRCVRKQDLRTGRDRET